MCSLSHRVVNSTSSKNKTRNRTVARYNTENKGISYAKSFSWKNTQNNGHADGNRDYIVVEEDCKSKA